MKQLGKVGTIGRFKPLHLGGAAMLESLCEQAEQVIIGIGSCNRYDARNPFTADESHAMVDALLAPRYSNYSIVHIPDFGHMPEYLDGQRWREEVRRVYGQLDAFVSGDTYVRALLEPDYQVMHPVDLLAEERRLPLCATQVRLAMARGDDWQLMVRPEVAHYIVSHELDLRFRKEFGLTTLATLSNGSYQPRPLSAQEERHRVIDQSVVV
jgi:nicotinamide-nucleotide adenylyltransferase